MDSTTPITPRERILVALDFDTMAKTIPFIEALAPHVGGFKVGLELLTAAGIPQAVQQIHRTGSSLFVDAKFHDIPNTVGAAARCTAALGVKMFNVHASAGRKALEAAAQNKGSSIALAVTILTSLDEQDCQEIYHASSSEKVIAFAKMAAESGMDGIVCSGQELSALSQVPELKSLIKVVPGIRPAWAEANDQKRTMTPTEAVRLGATYLVIGRPITNPPRGIGNPIDAARAILDELQSVSPAGPL